MTTIKEVETQIQDTKEFLNRLERQLATLKKNEEQERVDKKLASGAKYEYRYHEYDLYDIGQQVRQSFMTKKEALDKIREGWPDKVTHDTCKVFDMTLNKDHGEDMAYYDIEFDQLRCGWYPHEGEELEKDPNILVFFVC